MCSQRRRSTFRTRSRPSSGSVRLVVRTAGDRGPLLSVVRDRVSSIDRDVPVHRFQTLEEELGESIAPRRFNLYAMAAFAATALMLALVGSTA